MDPHCFLRDPVDLIPDPNLLKKLPRCKSDIELESIGLLSFDKLHYNYKTTSMNRQGLMTSFNGSKLFL